MSDKPTYRIAVTGSNGQLGMEIRRISENYPDYAFVFLSRDEFPLDDVKKVEAWIHEHPVDVFINCAAYTAVDKAESETEVAFQINAVTPGLMAQLLSKNKIHLIHISTDYVFDGHSATALSETAVAVPVNQYGASKLEGERMVLKNHPGSQIIRTSWLYSSYGNNFVKTMMRLMKDRATINVVEDQKGSPTYAGDLAVAILRIIESGKFIPGIYHYSNEGETNWFEFALEIKKLTASHCNVLPIRSASYPTPAKRPAFSLMDKSKIRRDYGLNIPDWKSSLAVCIDLIKKQGV